MINVKALSPADVLPQCHSQHWSLHSPFFHLHLWLLTINRCINGLLDIYIFNLTIIDTELLPVCSAAVSMVKLETNTTRRKMKPSLRVSPPSRCADSVVVISGADGRKQLHLFLLWDLWTLVSASSLSRSFSFQPSLQLVAFCEDAAVSGLVLQHQVYF